MKTLKILFELSLFVALFALMVILSACKTVMPIVEVPRNDSVVVRYEYIHDSVWIDRIHLEFLRGDTIILHDTVTEKHFKFKDKCDTLYKDKEVIIQPPPEKYIPKFYKWCTGLFWVILILIVAYIVLRIVIKIYLKK